MATRPAGRPPDRLRLHVLGSVLDVFVDDVTAVPVLATLLADLRAEGDATSVRADALVTITGLGPWVVASPGHGGTAATPGELVASVLGAVNLTAVACTRLLALHAGVLVAGDRVVVLPAASGTGKSTLAAALLTRGWAYVSDEALALDWETGAVVPYPRPLTLSRWSARAVRVDGVEAAGELAITAADLGATVRLDPGPVSDVVLLSRASPRGPSLEPVSRQEALEALLRRSFTHFLDPGRALQRYAGLLAAATCSRLWLGTPAASAELLDEELGGRRR